ncbi:MAG: hypothetical protein CVV64_04650 [Candidatus Wallbacteria bacterium HGW-Wallbacteria-1]|uniref:Bacterial sugar transferase domain-containing protein n=1 Tax=Candidatus Wallbacteria bacterium HGW-Wallbacteria-1 TaxID=2013854 RepID=A0A2N1PS10_9BACT|nr:MAG: hypothetical protein CVV64_04650 [Candidatus Wallbacteria bacterium HGW-Wallbacteria-1]
MKIKKSFTVSAGAISMVMGLADVLLVNAAVIATFLIRYQMAPPERNLQAYAEIFPYLTIMRILCLFAADLYYPSIKSYTNVDIFSRVSISSAGASILTVLAAFFNRSFAFPRSIMVLSMVMDILVISCFRIVLASFMEKKSPQRRLLIAGTGQDGIHMAEEILRHYSREYKVVGFLACKGQEPFFADSVSVRDSDQDSETVIPISNESGCSVPVMGLLDGSDDGELVVRVSRQNGIDEIIVTLDTGFHNHVLAIVFAANKAGIKVRILPRLYEIAIGRVEVREVAGIPFIDASREPMSGWHRAVKRALDIVVSLLGLILLSPLMLLVAIAVKITSSGPVFYAQERMRDKDNSFRIFKFRSMVVDAESVSGPVFARENDTRVTPIGKWLRLYRIDEIPQLWNVFLGQMSLVGPRPERESFVREFSATVAAYPRRFEMKPGLTGLAQIHGRYDITVENKLRYDLVYINNWSLLLDIKILLLTIKVILTARGAI